MVNKYFKNVLEKSWWEYSNKVWYKSDKAEVRCVDKVKCCEALTLTSMGRYFFCENYS